MPAITGRVFDDRDGDGVQGSGEPGVAGIPIALDGEIVGATGPGGRFNIPLPGPERALLALVPPEGWEWMGNPLLASDALEIGFIAIPLQRSTAEETEVPAAPTTTAATSAMVAVLLAGLVFSGVASLLQAAATRSLERTYRRQKAQELELHQYRVIEQRKEQVERDLAENDDWRTVLVQILADARPGTDVDWMTLTDVAVSPPGFEVAAQDGTRYTFTISPGTARRWEPWARDPVILLDAALSPTARTEVQAVWEYLTMQRELGTRPLPRRAEWFLVVRR